MNIELVRAMAKAHAASMAAELYAAWVDEGVLDEMLERESAGPTVREAYKAAAVELIVELYKRAGVRVCRVCGCTEDRACVLGCTWVEEDLCSSHPEERRIVVVPG